MHRIIYVCGLIALAIIITWVCFTFAGALSHRKLPIVIERVNTPVEQIAPPTAPIPDPVPPVVEPALPPPAIIEPVIPVHPPVVKRSKPKHIPYKHKPTRKSAPVEIPYCLFSDAITGDCIF